MRQSHLCRRLTSVPHFTEHMLTLRITVNFCSAPILLCLPMSDMCIANGCWLDIFDVLRAYWIKKSFLLSNRVLPTVALVTP